MGPGDTSGGLEQREIAVPAFVTQTAGPLLNQLKTQLRLPRACEILRQNPGGTSPASGGDSRRWFSIRVDNSA
jgi:hypothetical protein